MKKIILASGSAQRKKLLKLLDLTFTVRPSRVDELTKITTTCASLVKKNALIKAEDIATKSPNSIVIGADTVVYVGNKKMIGKPKTYKDARRILKTLSSKPQWVYTGVAIIDTSTGQKVIDYEKTRIHMLKLTDKEIEQYHKKVNPFDKAGGFDIEGWGSIFIHRIEGCYSNVIGLPISKLGLMLKKVGVSILSLLLCLTVVGCSSEFNLATQKEERLIYTTEREVRIGEKVAASIEKSLKINEEVDVNERVEKILEKIVAVCDRKDIVYFIKVIDEDLVNAISLPGGYVYIFKGLIDAAENDDQLAGVIAHEVGHITARHGVKNLQNAYAAMLAQLAAFEAAPEITPGVSLALDSLFVQHSQLAEFESDRLGVKYMRAAGYDPTEMAKFLKILSAEEEKRGARKFSYWRTHPFIARRIGVVNKEITGKLDFHGYLNLTGSDHVEY